MPFSVLMSNLSRDDDKEMRLGFCFFSSARTSAKIFSWRDQLRDHILVIAGQGKMVQKKKIGFLTSPPFLDLQTI